MKIGILTQHFLLNYGGIIQNYALQQVLIKLGHKPLTFEHDTCYGYFKWLLRSIKCIFRTQSFKYLPVRPVYKGRIGQKNFIKFILKHIQSVPVSKFTPSLTQYYDIEAYIVGSDQVWRPAFNLGDRLGNMFLDFVNDNVKKIAYAASFGTSEWEFTKDQTIACSTLAKHFDAISVREDSGVRLCQEHLGVEAIHVLDPTLLLNKEDYLKICACIPTGKRHLFVYSLVISDKLMAVATQIAKSTNLEIIIMEAGNKVKEKDSIEQWLAHFRDADFVITDSFHGMVFSLIFNVPFNVVINKNGGASRYISLLSQLALENRIIEKVPFMDIIDWNEVNTRLNRMKAQSLNFLKETLS